MVVSSSDFDNVASEVGEAVTIYNPTQTVSSDYGSLVTDTNIDSGGTSETAIIQPVKSNNVLRSEGKLKEGDCFGMFKSNSEVEENSLVLVGTNLYQAKDLTDIRPAGSTHHFEANLIFLRSTA